MIPGLGGECVLERRVGVFHDRLAVGDERVLEVDFQQLRQLRGRHAPEEVLALLGDGIIDPVAQAAVDADDPVAERERPPRVAGRDLRLGMVAALG